jgi:hypothetical protein
MRRHRADLPTTSPTSAPAGPARSRTRNTVHQAVRMAFDWDIAPRDIINVKSIGVDKLSRRRWQPDRRRPPRHQAQEPRAH